MCDGFRDRLEAFFVGEMEALMRCAEALRDFERDRTFVELRDVETHRERFQVSAQPLRGQRGYNRRVDSATQEAGDRDIGEKMLFHCRLEERTNFVRRGLAGRLESLLVGPVSPDFWVGGARLCRA